MTIQTSPIPKLKGVITALVTPFDKGEIDKRSFVRLIRHQLDQGIQGFVINGTTAESPNLSWEEVRQLFDLAKSEVAGQVPLIVGTGSNSTLHAVEMSRDASSWKPQALLVVVPYYNRPPQRGIEQHFIEVAKASSVPVIMYNVPSRTVAGLDRPTVISLSHATNIAGVKDATADLKDMAEWRSQMPGSFALLSGDDASCVEFCAKGGDGVISVSSHIIGAEMRDYIEQTKTQAAQPAKSASDEYEKRFAELLRCLYIESNPIPVKMALFMMGVIESPELRLPLMALDKIFHKELKQCLEDLGKIH